MKQMDFLILQLQGNLPALSQVSEFGDSVAITGAEKAAETTLKVVCWFTTSS
jgi:hypothetical protein